MELLYPEIDTPAVVVDLDKMERNLRRMQELADTHGVGLRPHIKTHKSPWIAHKQLAYGAKGITVAKLGEAEVMAEAGISNIVLAYPIVGQDKLRRLERLLHDIDIIVSLDSVEVAEGVGQAAKRAGRDIRVYIEVDTGLERLGLPAKEPTVQLVEAVAQAPGVQVFGLMTHAGHVAHAKDEAERERMATQTTELLVETAEMVRHAGIPVEEVSPGSTVGSIYDVRVDGVTEIRPGTYVFYDANYVRAGAATMDDCAGTILTTVVSRPSATRAVVDAGSKTLTSDGPIQGHSGYGVVRNRPGVRLARVSEEHGVLELDADVDLKVGDRIEVIPNHVCVTVNLSDIVYGVRNGRLEKEISVLARGKRR